jgi:LmbE family N-acetylglucosaminyl deacetylase
MKKYNLLVAAHPDDETIFFGGLLQVYRRKPWKVVCVTDGNADGQGEKRKQDLFNACRHLRVKDVEMWTFPDRFNQRLDLPALVERLKQESPSEIFTHGILGEYGHPHHQDVSLAVHRAFPKVTPVWSVAYNCFAEKVFRVPQRAYQRKCEVLSQVYYSETHRFARFLPAYSHEGFVRVLPGEIERLYEFMLGGTLPEADELKIYSWFQPYLMEFRKQIHERPF